MILRYFQVRLSMFEFDSGRLHHHTLVLYLRMVSESMHFSKIFYVVIFFQLYYKQSIIESFDFQPPKLKPQLGKSFPQTLFNSETSFNKPVIILFYPEPINVYHIMGDTSKRLNFGGSIFDMILHRRIYHKISHYWNTLCRCQVLYEDLKYQLIYFKNGKFPS